MATNDKTISLKDLKGTTTSSKRESEHGDSGKKKKKKRGCLFYGCFTITLLLMLITTIIGILLWMLLSLEPEPLPKIALDDDAIRRVKERIEQFEKALDEGKRAEVSFTGEELNVILIAFNELDRFKNHVYLYVEDNEVKGKVSFPPSMFATLERFVPKGVFLNGNGKFSIYVSGGEFHVHMESLKVKDRSLPEAVMAAIRSENLAARIPLDVKRKERIKKIRSVTMRRDRLYAESSGKR
jgi:hypothetical protein